MATQGKVLVQPDRLPLEIHRVVFDEDTIARKVLEIGRQISRDYQGKDLLLVGILKGAFVFAGDLIRAVSIPVELDFISITKYSSHPSDSTVRIVRDIEPDLSGRDVLLLEDLVDTGLTLNYLVGVLRKRRPASVSICALLDRPDLRLVDIPIKYSGFYVNHEFLIGYGLDYRDHFREIPYIASVKFDAP